MPEYSLTFQIPFIVTDEKSIIFAASSTNPPKAKISTELCKVVYEVSLSYVFANRDNFKLGDRGLSAHLSFAPNTGINVVSTNDGSLKTLFEKMSTEAVPFSPSEAKEQNIFDLLRKKPTEEARVEAQKTKGKRAVFFEPITVRLWNGGVRTSEEIKLNIQVLKATSEGGGLTTGHLRFPHMLQGIAIELQKKGRLESMDLKVCIVGPGFKEEGRLGYCPQLVELRSIMPNAEYLLLDNDKKAVALMEKAFIKQQMISYDPTMLRSRTTILPNMKNPYLVPEPLLSFLNDMKSALAEQVIAPKNAKAMMKGEGNLEEVVVKLDSRKIELREFDICSSEFKDSDKGQFDVVVATMSLSIVYKEEKGKITLLDNFKRLARFVELLKPEGFLYVDTLLLESLRSQYGKTNLELGLEYLGAVIGCQLMIYYIPLSNVDPGSKEIFGSFPDCNYKSEMRTISTSGVDCIKRTSEKLETSPERLAEITAKLERLV